MAPDRERTLGWLYPLMFQRDLIENARSAAALVIDISPARGNARGEASGL